MFDNNNFEDNFHNESLNNSTNSVARSTPFGTKSMFYKDICGEFTENFYSGAIDLPLLLRFLNTSGLNGMTAFDWSVFSHGNVITLHSIQIKYNYISLSYETVDVYKERVVSIPFTYITDNNIEKKGSFYLAKLNKRVCLLSGDISYLIKIDSNNSNIKLRCNIYYKNTKKFRRLAKDTANLNDFRIDNKYVAIQLATKSAEDLLGFIENIQPNNNLRKLLITKFNGAFDRLNDTSKLDWLYSNTPQFILNQRNTNLLWKDLLSLLKTDKKWNFHDTSNSIIKVIKAFFIQPNGSKILFQKLLTSGTIIKEIYDNLSGNSISSDGQISPNKNIFASLINIICHNNIEDTNRTNIKFYINDNSRIDSNIILKDDESDKFNLQQEILITKKHETISDYPSLEDGAIGIYRTKPYSYTNFWLKQGEVHSLHPMDMVTLSIKGPDNQEIQIEVAAIILKNQAELREWKELEPLLRIGIDIIMIVAGAITFGSGVGGLILYMAAADILLASTDITIQILRDEIGKTEGGEEFLETWEKIYLVGGIVTGLPLLTNLLKGGAKLLLKVISIESKELIIEILKNALRQLKNFPKFVKGQFEIISEFTKIPKMKVLAKEGVLLVNGLKDGKSAKEYFLIFKGEVIGSAKNIRRLNAKIRDLVKKGGKRLGEYLEELTNNRTLIKVKNVKDIGKQGNKVIFNLVDSSGKAIGKLVRTIGEKGRRVVYKLNGEEIESYAVLLNRNHGKEFNLPVNHGENLFFADFNIPKRITDQFSGLGEIMLDDALAFFKGNKKFKNVEGTLDLYQKSARYADYGGQSIILKQFWKAVDSGMDYEQAAFSTFAGKWAEKNGFVNVVINDLDKDILPDQVLLKFLKN